MLIGYEALLPTFYQIAYTCLALERLYKANELGMLQFGGRKKAT